MIQLETFTNLADHPIGDFSPKPTRVTDDQVEALAPLWTSEDKLTKIGIWECTPGKFTADRSQIAEYCHIISGSATVRNLDDLTSREIKGGDLLVLPIGWTGEWTVHEHMRKLHILNANQTAVTV